jgi:hypothetical protein
MHVNLPDKRYYSIGELAKAFEVNPSLIRFWEKEFDILQPKKKCQGQQKIHAGRRQKSVSDLPFSKGTRIYLGRG